MLYAVAISTKLLQSTNIFGPKKFVSIGHLAAAFVTADTKEEAYEIGMARALEFFPKALSFTEHKVTVSKPYVES